MKREIIFTTGAPAPIGPYSQAIKVDNTLYVSGQIALDATSGQLISDNITVESQKVFENVGAVLVAAGMDYANVVKVSIFITDMDQFSQINEVYAGFFSDLKPARETVQVSRLPKDVNIEVSVIAVG